MLAPIPYRSLGKDPTVKTQSKKRKWAPRSRSGCITCRIRRVRCDEGRPFCKRCTSTGRTCDGYKDESLLSATLTVPRELGHRLPGQGEERSHFHFFASSIVLKLPPFFDFGFWDTDFLKACNVYPALFHASAAMAAVHRILISRRTLELSASDKDTLSLFMLRQFNQSINYIKSAIQTGSDEDRGIILATCIVFICLSAFQDRPLEAIGHIQSGVRIMYSWKARGNNFEHAAGPVSGEILSILLTRLDTQARCLQLPVQDGDTARDLQVEQSFLTEGLDLPLQSFLQAYGKIEALCNSVLRMIQRASKDMEERDFYFSCFNLWKAKLSMYLADIRISVPVLAVTSCEIRIAFTNALLKYDPLKDELGWDDIEDDFDWIVRHAADMLENEKNKKILYAGPVPKGKGGATTSPSASSSSSSSSSPPPPSSSLCAAPFTLAAGVCDILYFVALHCREPHIRRQAIRTLKDYPRREGICHTALLGAIAEAVMIREETTLCSNHRMGLDTLRCDSLSDAERHHMICGNHRIRNVQIIATDGNDHLAEVSMWTVEYYFDPLKSNSEVVIPW